MTRFYTLFVPLILLPLVFAGIAAAALQSIVPSGSIASTASIAALALVVFGAIDRATFLPPFPSAAVAKDFAVFLMTRYSVALAWTAAGFLLGYAMEMNPPWPAVPALIAGTIHVRKLMGQSESRGEEEVPEHVRGRKLLTSEELLEKQLAALPPGDPGIEFGGARTASNAATGGFMIQGIIGSGKTVSLRMLMQQVLPHIDNGGDYRALVYDAKGDMLPILHGLGLRADIQTMNPLDERAVAWDLARDITDLASAQELANILIPEEGQGNQPYFPNAARQLLTIVTLALSKKAGFNWTLRDLIVACEGKNLEAILKSESELWWRVRDYFTAKELPGVITTLSSQMARFEPVAAAWQQAKQQLSLTGWVKTNSILVLGTNPAVRSAANALNQILVERLSEIILSQPDSPSRRTWVFLDEFRTTGELRGLSELMTRGRSKGVCMVLGFQDINGLNEAFGENVAAEITGQCWNKAFLRVDDNASAEWASLSLGEQERWEYQTSETTRDDEKSKTVDKRLVTRRIVTPSEIKSMLPAGAENGVPGYYVTAHLGAYQHTIPGWRLKELKPLDISVPGYIALDTPQTINRWNAADLERLNLQFLSGPAQEDQAPDAGLWSNGRISRPLEPDVG